MRSFDCAPASVGSTLRSRTRSGPSRRSCSCISWLAPSPIARIDTTEATPKTMPSTVRAERSLCTCRLRAPTRRSCSQKRGPPLIARSRSGEGQRALEVRAQLHARARPGLQGEVGREVAELRGELERARARVVERDAADGDAVDLDLVGDV